MAAEDMHIAVFHGLAQGLLIKGPARQQSVHGTGDMHQQSMRLSAVICRDSPLEAIRLRCIRVLLAIDLTHEHQ